MPEPQAQKTLREIVRDTFTPSRVGLLSWAFGAILMGTVALASYQFGNTATGFLSPGARIAGLPLPPTGDVRSTGSVDSAAYREIEVLRAPDGSAPFQVTTLEQSQIEVLQEQIVRLRRRISTLSEQNAAYSRRISSLEEEIGTADQVAFDRRNVITDLSNRNPDVQADPPELAAADAAANGPTTPLPKPERLAALETIAPEDPGSASTGTKKTANPRRITIHSGQQSAPPQVEPAPTEPVRIVELPVAAGEPVSTGSIPPAANLSGPDNFDSTPTQTRAQPQIIAPTEATGRLRGGGQSLLKRSDFGAVVGYYPTVAEASKAWGNFKEQNEERMEGLRPLILERAPTGDMALLVGPFGNAADAATACYRLLEVTELCQPSLYAGSPLVTTANFPANSF